VPYQIAISLPHGRTIGGVTSWAMRVAQWAAARERAVTLFFHKPLAGHRTIDLPEKLHRHSLIEVVELPSIEEAFDTCFDAYAARLPMVLLPNFNDASYRLAAALVQQYQDRVRVLAVCHGDNPQDYEYLTRYEPVVIQYLGVSQRCAQVLTEKLPNRSNNIAALAHGVEVPAPIDRAPLDDRPLRLLYAGRIEQGIKRITDVLAIAWLLAERNIAYEMLLVGDGPHASMVDRLIETVLPRIEPRSGSVRRIDAVASEATSQWYAWADVFLLASRLEGMNVALLEAMAHGCVPVVSDVASGTREVIGDGDNGFLFPIGDVTAATDRLEELSKNAEQLVATAASARATIVSNFSHTRYIERFLSLADRVWKSPPVRGVEAISVAESALTEEPGAVLSKQDPRYQSLLDMLAARADVQNLVVYGLGVNGLTLLDLMRHDERLARYRLFVADDRADAALFKVVGMPRVFPVAWPNLTHNTLVIVTPNDGAGIIHRLMGRGAQPGVHVVSLSDLGEEASQPQANAEVAAS